LKPQNKRKRLARRNILYERPTNQNRTEDGRRIIDLDQLRFAAEANAFKQTKEQRMRMYGLDERSQSDVKFAGDQECGHSVGRLLRHLAKHGYFGRDKETIDLTVMRLNAASIRYSEIMVAYNKDILGVRTTIPAMDMNRVGGQSTRQVSKQEIDAITANYTRLMGALEMACKGKLSKAEMFRIMRLACLEDAITDNWPDRQIQHLVVGLDAVAAAC